MVSKLGYTCGIFFHLSLSILTWVKRVEEYLCSYSSKNRLPIEVAGLPKTANLSEKTRYASRLIS